MTECDGCARALLVDLEKEDGGLALLRQLVPNITDGLARLSLLEADTSQTKVRAHSVLPLKTFSTGVYTSSISPPHRAAMFSVKTGRIHLHHYQLRVDGCSGAVRWLEPNVEQLEADIVLVGNDLTCQNNEVPVEKFGSQNMNMFQM